MADTIRHVPRVERANRIKGAGRKARARERTEFKAFVRAMLRDEDAVLPEPLPARVLHESIWAL